MGIKEALLRFARMVVDQVGQQVTQQVQVIENQVSQSIQSFVQKIVGGVWEGDDANAFVDEVNNRLMREIGEVTQSIAGIGQSLTTAVDIIDQADQKAQNLAEGLGETLAQIY